MIDLKDIHSLSEFQRNTRAHVEHLKAAHAAAIMGIQRGLQGMYEGTGDDAGDVFASLERELEIPEQP